MTTRDRNAKQKGQGMVEFAIVFPLLLLLVFGIFEFGRLMFSYSAAIAASREAARYGAAIQDVGGISQYEDCEGIRDAAKRIGKFAGVDDSDITIQYSNVYGVYSTSCPPSQEVKLADKISITVNTTISPFTPLGNFSGIPVTSSASRTILKSVKLGSSGTGAGSIQGATTDVNFKTTSQTAEETKSVVTVEVVLNEVSANDVSVPFSLSGTAVEGSDYSITSSPVTIPAGSTSTVITVNLADDGVAEGDESIMIGLGTPTNATKGPQNIHTIIVTDAPEIEFSVASSSKSEAMNTFGIMVELSKGSNQDVSVPISSSGSADWGAYNDYTFNPTTVTVPSGSLTAMFTVTVNDDEIDEFDEQVVFSLGSPTNGHLGDQTTHTLTIQDDDTPPQVSFNSAYQVVSEEIGTYYTTIYLDEVSGKDITVPFSTSGTVTAGDFTIVNPSPLTIPAGDQSADIEITIAEGDGYEEDETLVLTLDTPTNGVLGTPDQQQITITEDTPEPNVQFSVSSSSVIEGNTYLNIGVDLTNAWFQDIDVNYSISGTAQNGSSADYLVDSSPLTIPAGWSHGDIQVRINEDAMDEADETMVLTLDSAAESSGSLTFTLGSPQSYTLTIEDDDSAPSIAFQSSSQTVLETGGSVSLNVVMSNPAGQDVTIPLSYSGSATQDADYTVNTTNLVIPSGSTSGTFTVGILDDADYDPDEQVTVSLGSPTNAVLGSPADQTITIEDNELQPCNVGTHLITVGTDSVSWSLVNDGESVTFTGGSIDWPKASGTDPQLTSITFAGNTVWSGSENPGTTVYSASENFGSLATEKLIAQFATGLGSGTHTLTANFEHTGTGMTCSETVEYNNP